MRSLLYLGDGIGSTVVIRIEAGKKTKQGGQMLDVQPTSSTLGENYYYLYIRLRLPVHQICFLFEHS